MRCPLALQCHVPSLTGVRRWLCRAPRCCCWAQVSLQHTATLPAGSGGGSWMRSATGRGHLPPAPSPLPHQRGSGSSWALLEPVARALKAAPALPCPASKHTLLVSSLRPHGAAAAEWSIHRNERLERSLPVRSGGCRGPRPGLAQAARPSSRRTRLPFGPARPSCGAARLPQAQA